MTMNSTHLENSKNLKSDNQLILLKAYKRKLPDRKNGCFSKKLMIRTNTKSELSR